MMLTAASCFKPKPIEVSDEEIREVLSHLLASAEELNEIYYGEGLPTRELDEGNEGAVYLEISDKAKYRTSEELRAATFEVFSNALATNMYMMGVQGYYNDEDEELGTELGIDMGIASRYTEMLGIFCMRASMKEPSLELGRKYDIESATIVDRTSTSVDVKIMSEKDGEKLEVTLRLVSTESQDKLAQRENGATEGEITDIAETTAKSPESFTVADPEYWRLDTPTY